MKNTEKLKNAMTLGRVYRRQELEGFSGAVDRDLKTLVRNGEVKRLAGGLYYRPERNAFGVVPPSEKELVRAFLKTDDFLVTSHNYFNQLGLGLTQLYNDYVVYNHHRTGDFDLGGRRFRFRRPRSFPRELSKEFLLVDLLNSLKELPDDTSNVLKSLKMRLKEFDPDKVQECLARYGKARAREALSTANVQVLSRAR